MLPGVVRQIEAARRFTSLDRFHASARRQVPFSKARVVDLTIATMPAWTASDSIVQASTTERRSSEMGCSGRPIRSLVLAGVLLVPLICVIGLETVVLGGDTSDSGSEGSRFESWQPSATEGR